jgi:peptidoglycan/LPS O-acetylase OafA/YrhL
LDGVRGLAILLVVVWHYAIVLLMAHPPAGEAARNAVRAFSLTWSGVDLFFVLSGFLIGGILLDQREAPGYFRAFYARRLCRIVPLYLAVLGLFLLLWLAFHRGPAFAWLLGRPMPAWSYLTFTQNIPMAWRNDLGACFLSVTWSLAVEEQFYLVLPLVIRWLPRRWLPAAFVALAALGPALRVAMDQRFEEARFVLMPCRLDSLMLGVLCAWLLRHEGAHRWLAGYRRLLYAPLAALAAGALFSSFRPHPFAALNIYPWRYTWLALLYSCFLLLGVLEGEAGGGPVSALTRLRPLRRLGGLAYGLYMIHQAVNGFAQAFFLGHEPRLQSGADLLVILASLAVSLALAAASWRWFEKPILALGQSVSYGAPAAARLRRAA